MAQAGEGAGQRIDHRAGIRSAAHVDVLRQRVAAIARGHLVDDVRDRVQQGIGLAIDGQRGIRPAERDGGIDVVVAARGGAAVLLVAAIVERQAGRLAGGGDGRIDVDIALRAQGQSRVGAPLDRRIDVDVALAAAAGQRLQFHVGALQKGRQRIRPDAAAGRRAGAGAHREIGRVDQPVAGLARRRLGADIGPAGNGHRGRRGLDKAAIAAGRRAGVQRAAHGDAVIDHVAQEHDLPLLARGQRARLRDAGMVDDRAGQFAGRLGRQVHQPAIGADGPALLDQRIERAGLDFQLDRAAQVQLDAAARSDQHIAPVGHQGAGVGHLGGDQRDGAARRGGDIALVDDGIAARALEAVIARQEVRGADVQRAGHQAAHIDLRRRREQHPVRVHQEDLAIGVQGALDDRHIRSQHPVQRHRVAAGLVEIDRLALPDREALPVDGQLAARLVDIHGVAVLADAARTGHHLPARGQIGRQRRRRRQQRRAQYRGRRRPAALAAAVGMLGHGYESSQAVVPDQTIDVVKGRHLHGNIRQRHNL
ncbi:hypothetical protein L543_3758 [Bordetella hinzii L60]|nr:hypothetical protein L543_3758 [Bordetella hinzii L60]